VRSQPTALALLVVAMLVAAGSGRAQTGSTEPVAAAGHADPRGLATFCDAFFAEKMAELRVPGAAFVLVKDGEIVLARGYGFSDLEARVPVDPARTVFRLGSVSKLMTATAVMQLAERGQLRLDADVNTYLRRFQLPATFASPVTVADLLKHTGGFDERHIGMHARTAAEHVPLGEYLAARMPARIRPPGQIIAYSDFGASLAGLIVEEVSGQPFATYVAENIFEPLGMTSSSFEQPMPPGLMARLATGYGFRNGRHIRYAYDFAEVSPAAALQGTALDLANFLIAHLEGGRLGDARILEPATVATMHATQVTHHPRLRGRAYGFSEWLENGQRALFHDGGMPGYMCRVLLLPEHRLGFAVAHNGDSFTTAAYLGRTLTSAFLVEYFGPQAAPPALTPPEDFADRAGRFVGTYRSLHEYSRNTLEKVVSLEEQVRVSDAGDGTLQAFGGTLVEVQPLLFRWQGGDTFVAFAADRTGQVEKMFGGTAAYQKLPWYETRPVHLGLAVAFLLCFVAAPIGAFVGRAELDHGTSRRLPLALVTSLSLLNLAMLIGFPVAMLTIDRWQFMYGLPQIVVSLLAAPILAALAAVVLLGTVARAWWRGVASGFARFWCTTLLGVELAFLAWLHYWNLLGLRT